MGKKRRRSDASESDHDSNATTPVRKRLRADKWSIPAEINHKTELCHKLYDFLRKYKDESNHVLCEFLIRAPSRRLLPEYYDVVASPIDLMKIQQKLKMDEYRTVQSFVSDIQLLLNNAKTFYMRSSEEYDNTMALERAFHRSLEEYVGETGAGSRSPPPSLTLKISKEQLLSAHPEKTKDTSSIDAAGSSSHSKTSHTTPKSGPKSSQTSHATPKASSSTPKLSQASHTTPKSSQASFSTPKSAPVSYTSSTKAVSSGGKLAIKMKLTRSKAWLQEYVSSENPIKIFLATVYDYHDPNGEYVAELFQELPSAKDYPEYYRVIAEPIDLSTIKNNIEDGMYTNLKQIQDDMLLMVKNAHHFNEPGSEIYKLANSLRRFVIIKCAELERKYQTVTKSMPLKVSLKRPSGAVMDPGISGGEVRRKRSSQTSSESEVSESESEEELSSDGEESVGGGKLLLRIKKEKFAGVKAGMDRLTKLLKARKLPPLKKRLMAIYRVMVAKTDSDGRSICELFMRKPSAKVYPEYYVVIKQPIDLREIYQKIRNNQYPNMEELMASIDLMITNACTFNEEGSQVYNDALTLKEAAEDAYKQLQQGWQPCPLSKVTKGPGRPRGSTSIPLASSPGVTLEAGGSSGVVAVEKSPMMQLFETVKECNVPPGRYLWLMFRQLPPLSPGYYSVIKRPIDIQTISSKLQGGQYTSAEQLFLDLNLLYDNTCRYHGKETQPYTDALNLHKATVAKFLQLTAKEKEARIVPDVQKCVQKLLREIMSKTTNLKDGSGKKVSDFLLEVTATQDLQDEGEEATGLIRRTFTLPRVVQWVDEGRYTRLDQLQSDLLAIFRQARKTSKVHSEICKFSIGLERLYLGLRDQVCMRGQLLSSPAFNYTTMDLDTELSLRTPSAPIPPSSPSSYDVSEERESSPEGSGSESDDSSSQSEHSPEPREEVEVGVVLPDESSRQYFQEIEHEDTVYRVGDIVYVTPRKPGQQNHIVILEGLWKDGSGTMWLDGCWFYRPEETFHLAVKKFYKKEVFKSDFHGLAKLSRVQGKCSVMFIKDYPKYFPEGFSDEHVYVCESRYAYKTKHFKKIRNWNFIPGPPVKLVPRSSPLTLNRVPSVFVANQLNQFDKSKREMEAELEKGAETEEDMEVDDHDTSINVVEMPFSETLLNVPVSVPNPEANCNYYEQYCIDDDRFRLGDFVYVRSDQEFPFIARIDKMWSDGNGDPWFHGPWFIRPSDVEHLPTRMFYEKELFMSEIQDTNPMRSIIGKCTVLYFTDYCKKRPTEYQEDDVFVTECRYNEADKETKKMKGLKHFHPSASVLVEEVYHFQQDIQPLKLAMVPSPYLFQKNRPTIELKKEPLVKPGGAAPQTGAVARQVPLTTTAATMLNLNPQLLHTLLSSAQQLSSTKPVIIPLPSPLTTMATIPQLSPTTSSGSSMYICRWEGCGRTFENASPLTNHLLFAGMGGHVNRDVVDGMYYCKWSPCPRNPKLGGRPFDTLPKLTRHLKEVHLMKLSQSALGLTPRNHWPVQLHSLAPTTVSPVSSPATSITPSVQLQPLTLSALPNSSQPLPSAPVATVLTQPVVVATSAETKSCETQASTSTEAPGIFQPPPKDRRKLTHSEIYLKYINSLQSNTACMSSSESSQSIRANQRSHPPRPIQASDWLSSEAIQQSDSVVDALWALRDHLLDDSMKLANYLENIH